jgi:hypothetical protein
MPIYGFISTSLEREAAMNFANNDDKGKKFAVLYEI